MDEQMMRKVLFAKCDTQDQLKDWVELFIGFELPDCTVDPDSTSNPMALLFELYTKAREGDDQAFQRILAYASRDSYKTIITSVLEVLALFHLRRSVAHMAAVESQAKKAQQYVKKYFRRKALAPFVTMQNERRIEITYYEDRETGDIYSHREFENLDPQAQERCAVEQYYIQIIVATLAGANSEHTSLMVVDECDLAPPGPYEEAKMIPAPGLHGELPITLLTSSRKFATGPVQKEIDKADETGLIIRHWNIIDVTKACPPLPEKPGAIAHRPDEPKVFLWVEKGDPKRILQDEEAQALTDREREKLTRLEGYAGCKTCPLFAACQGRLATKQKSTSKLLKPISHVINQFRSISTEVAAAQLMCWKPSSEGMIWAKLNRERHMKTASQMAELITGEKYPDTFAKMDLIRLIQSMSIPFMAGMDHGFTHAFAVVTGALDGQKLYVIDSICSPGLELTERIEICDARIKHLSPTIYPDQAYPADNKTFQKRGYRMMKFKKDVAAGIEAVRMRLEPGADKEPNLFFLAGDENCEFLFKSISEYHYKVDAAGKATEIPDDTDDDLADALKYLCQNLSTNKKPIVSSDVGEVNDTPPLLDVNAPGIYTQDNFLAKKIEELTQHTPSGTITGMSKGKRGGFFFSG